MHIVRVDPARVARLMMNAVYSSQRAVAMKHEAMGQVVEEVVHHQNDEDLEQYPADRRARKSLRTAESRRRKPHAREANDFPRLISAGYLSWASRFWSSMSLISRIRRRRNLEDKVFATVMIAATESATARDACQL